MKENGDDGDSESGYSYKQKLQKQLFNHSQENSKEGNNEKKKSKKRKHSELESSIVEEIKTKQIKTEPESDLDIKPKKKKSKTSISDSFLKDEEFLNLKVKEEQMSIDLKPPKPKKKKKQRTNSENAEYSSFSESQSQEIDNSQSENADIHLELSQQNEYSNFREEPEDNERVKKKKKSKKKKEKDNIEDAIIEEKFNAEETIVEERIANVYESQSNIENKLQKERTDESMDESEGAYNDTKQNISRQLDNTSHIEEIQDKSKIKKKQNSLFDNVAVTDEIISANGSITPSKPLRKITDRIKFENDTLDFSNDEIEVKGSKHSAALRKYLKKNTHLNQIKVNHNSGAVITEEDEVWVLKCPSEVDINSLKDTSLVLDTKCKLKANNQTYVGYIENYTPQVAILTLDQNKPVIKNVPISGMIQFSKRIPKPHYMEENSVNNQSNFIPLPETKSRHPLFGVHYKSAIKIPKHISDRLNGLETELIPEDNEKRKKKKKKHKKETNGSEDEMKPEPEPEPVRKKRKLKHSNNDDTSPKLSKRLKHDPDSAEAWDSEKAIEQQLFNF